MVRCSALIGLALVLATAMLLPGCGVDSEGPEGPAEPACDLDVDSLSFGAVTVGDSLDLTFKITNTGGGTLAGTVSEACTDFAIVGNASYSLGAGDSATFTVRFSPASAGSKACTIETGASQCADLPLSGAGVAAAPACQVNPASLDFGAVSVGAHKDTTFTIRNTGGGTLSGEVYADCDDFSIVGNGEFDIGADQSATFTVRFAPASAGPAECTIEMDTGFCDGISCTGLGEVAPICEVDPTGLDFGLVELGGSADLSFTIQNTGGGTLSGTVSSPCGGFSLIGSASYSLGPDQSATLTVRFSPDAVGTVGCAIETGSGYCGDVGSTGVGVPHADYYVDASSGSDANPGTPGAPFRTITYAVAAAGPNKTIFVAPGTYDAVLGETFPIRLQQGQSLIGDVSNRGEGTPATIIYGSGDADPTPGYDDVAALVGADGSSIAGFSIGAPYTVYTYGVYIVDAAVSLSDNTFTSAITNLYGGVWARGNGASVITGNYFLTSSYGVYSSGCTGGMVVQSNLFQSMGIPIDMSGVSNNTIVRANTIVGTGQSGIQVQNGVPLIEDNVFNKPGGYANYGAIRCWFDHANAVIRGNTFICARGVRIDEGAPDLGTGPDPGGNDFSGVTGVSVYHMGTSSISAVGNTWASSPPGCGSGIVITGTGSVTWGTGAGESCP